MNNPLINIIGQKFGRLTVLKLYGKNGYQKHYVCKCDCGKNVVVRSDRLKPGNRSCGCLSSELKSKRFTKHGGSRKMAEYNIWCAMKARCKRSKFYTERKIVVCERWLNSFSNFISDMGKRPSSDLSLERVDNDKGYEPDNCMWATKTQQANNTKRSNREIEINGVSKKIHQWREIYKIKRGTYHRRIRMGQSITEALTTPLRK